MRGSGSGATATNRPGRKRAPRAVPAGGVLDDIDDPRPLLNWLAGVGGMLLGELVAHDGEITHEVLDRLRPRPAGEHLRALLVHAGILSLRDHDHLDRVDPWLDDFLAGRPSDEARMLRAYAAWFVLRRARQRARRRTPTAASAKYARVLITTAAGFLAWIDAKGLTMATITQADVDQWLAEGRTTRRRVRNFLSWARAAGLTGDVSAPWLGRTDDGVEHLPDEDTRWSQLRRCVTDSSMPLQLRVAGALLLLYGQPLSRTSRLRVEAITKRDGRTHITFDGQPVLLPPQLALLVDELASTAQPRHLVGRHQRSPWLFPGGRPGQPVSAGYLAKLLGRDFAIRARPARNAALCALATELPAPILADLLGLDVNTATRWARIARRDWLGYIASRVDEVAGEGTRAAGVQVSVPPTKMSPTAQ